MTCVADSLCRHACNATRRKLRIRIDLCRVTVSLQIRQCAFCRFVRPELEPPKLAKTALFSAVVILKTYLDGRFRHDFYDIQPIT